MERTEVNGWFPRFQSNGVIASGDAGIWVTPTTGTPYRHSPIGLAPIWAGITLVFNRNDGTTQVGSSVVTAAYNAYSGSMSGNWAGFNAGGAGRIDRYNGPDKITSIVGATEPRFGGPSFGYLSPYQPKPDNLRALIIEGSAVAIDKILTWAWERSGAFFVYQVATGIYSRAIKDAAGNIVSVRDDEAPIVAFLGPEKTEGPPFTYPWLLSGTQDATIVHPVGNAYGYRIDGDLYFPDALMIGDQLRVVGSTAQGVPRFDNWIDFTAPRTDLRRRP